MGLEGGTSGYCISPTLYFRVDNPDALKWIKSFQGTNIKFKGLNNNTTKYIV